MAPPWTKKPPRGLHVFLSTALLTLALGGAVALMMQRQSAADNAVAASITQFGSTAHAAPDFHLRDQFSRPSTLATLRGKAVVLTFLTAACYEECSLIGQRLASVDRALSAEERQRVTYLAVSVAPPDGVPPGVGADTPTTIAHFIAVAGLQDLAHAGRFRFLTGRQATLAPVWKAYGIGVVAPLESSKGQTGSGHMAHTVAVCLIGPDGILRAVTGLPIGASEMATALSSLLH